MAISTVKSCVLWCAYIFVAVHVLRMSRLTSWDISSSIRLFVPAVWTPYCVTSKNWPTEADTYESASGKSLDFNTAHKMNDLLVNTLKQVNKFLFPLSSGFLHYHIEDYLLLDTFIYNWIGIQLPFYFPLIWMICIDNFRTFIIINTDSTIIVIIYDTIWFQIMPEWCNCATKDYNIVSGSAFIPCPLS